MHEMDYAELEMQDVVGCTLQQPNHIPLVDQMPIPSWRLAVVTSLPDVRSAVCKVLGRNCLDKRRASIGIGAEYKMTCWQCIEPKR